MIVHSALHRGLMLEWIKDCLDEGQPTPDDDAIMERFEFESPEQARTLLADLADRGAISITGTGANRAIALGRAAGKPMPPARPLATVRKPAAPAAPEQSNADRIRAILARGKAALAPAPVRQPDPEPVPAPPTEAVAPVAAPTPPPDSEPVAPAARRVGGRPQRAVELVPGTDAKKQLNIHMPLSSYRGIAERAEAAGQTPSAYLRGLIAAHLADGAAGFNFEAGQKPRVRAAIVAAAAAERVELYDFLTDLMERGFAVYLEDQLEHAEAAE